MTRAKLPLLALFVLSASAASAQPVAPVPIHVDLLQAVRAHTAVLRSEPIRLNSEPLHPFRARPVFPEVSLPPVAMTEGVTSTSGCFR